MKTNNDEIFLLKIKEEFKRLNIICKNIKIEKKFTYDKICIGIYDDKWFTCESINTDDGALLRRILVLSWDGLEES